MRESSNPRGLRAPVSGVRSAARVGAAALLALLVALTSGCSTSSQPAPAASTSSPVASDGESGIGSWPTFLPSPSAGGVAHGSVATPALSFPGSPVVVDLDAGGVRLAVDGPTYPASTKVGAAQVDCVFTVVFSEATAPVTLSGAQFDVLDHSGAVHRLAVHGTLPASLAPGSSLTVTATGTLPSGQGLLRFYPPGSSTAAAAWDYVAETD